jgi:8-oxo-dGTP pyrophosphatase MutT (NUDIX family)
MTMHNHNDDTDPQDIRAASSALIKELSSGLYLLEYSNDRKAWQTPGGRLHVNESPYDALVRELREEISFDASKMKNLKLTTLDFHFDKQAGDSMMHFFFTRNYSGSLADEIHPDNVEVNDFGLFTETEILDKIADPYAVERVKNVLANPNTRCFYLENAAGVF